MRSDPRAHAWRGFTTGDWCDSIDVRGFIQANYTPYEGDGAFLADATERTTAVWDKLSAMFPEEREKGVYDVDWQTPASITAHKPGYIDEDNEVIVGLQTDAPLKRAIMPFGGWRMVVKELETYGYPVDPALEKIFSEYRKTHNDGVFDVYPPNVRAARSSHIVTGLPDAYGRGRIIGDYRRVALYGVDALIEAKKVDRIELDMERSTEDVIRDREENSEQIKALRELKAMAASYGFDISQPASTGREAVQWLYFAYLAAVKEQNGAAMSLGRTSTLHRRLHGARHRCRRAHRGAGAGDHRRLRHQAAHRALPPHPRVRRAVLRRPHVGDRDDWRHGRGRPSARHRSRPSATCRRCTTWARRPEPNLTVFWSDRLPLGFKEFCARVSIDTSAIQYESDELIRPAWGDDSAIACCVSAMCVGKQMQFFGARVNLAKAMLYAINGGRDEVTGKQVAPVSAPVAGDVLDYDEVFAAFDTLMDWLAETYVDALNCIHYMHDKYAYERIEMALHDKNILRTMACGIAGLSVVSGLAERDQVRRGHARS